MEIVGAAGIGKTRLLAELAARADARGHIVLTGSGAELERDLPFWVFVDALDEYIESVEPRRARAASTRTCGSSWRRSSRRSPRAAAAARGASQGERYRTNRAVRELLERLAATRPLVLILDDVHWADPASVDLLGSLLRRPPDAAVLLVARRAPAARCPARLASALERAHRDGDARRASSSTR